jgi:hypothetical protein
MQRILTTLLVLAWALWLGGLVTLFMAVNSVFATLSPDRTAAGSITAPIFHLFERYQLALAGIAVLSTVGLRLLSCSRAKRIVLILLLLAAAVAVGQTSLITWRMDELRISGEGGREAFRTLHGVSMALYFGITLLLAATGLFLPRMVRDDADGIPLPQVGAAEH